ELPVDQELPVVAVLEDGPIAHESPYRRADVLRREHREAQQPEVREVELLIDMQTEMRIARLLRRRIEQCEEVSQRHTNLPLLDTLGGPAKARIQRPRIVSEASETPAHRCNVAHMNGRRALSRCPLG